MFLHVVYHGFSRFLRTVRRMDNSLCPGDYITSRKSADSCRHIVLINLQQASISRFQSFCCSNQFTARRLADRDDRGICVSLYGFFLTADDFIVLIEDRFLENRAFFCNLFNLHTEGEFGAIEFRIGKFLGACRHIFAAGV